MNCGVYKITNLSSGRFYIGSAQDIYKRRHRHFRALRAGTHHNIFLQRVYNKYGEEDFKVQYIRTDSVEEARKREQKFLNKHCGNPSFMNIGRDACGGDNLTSHPKRKKIVAKMTKSIRKRMASMSKEERVEAFGRSGEQNGMYGKTHTEKTRKKLSEVHSGNSYALGAVRSEAFKERLREVAFERSAKSDYVNPFAGKKHTAETLVFLATVNVGRTPSNARKIKIGRKKFDSLRAAADKLGVVPATVLYRVRSENYPDYEYLN